MRIHDLLDFRNTCVDKGIGFSRALLQFWEKIAKELNPKRELLLEEFLEFRKLIFLWAPFCTLKKEQLQEIFQLLDPLFDSENDASLKLLVWLDTVPGFTHVTIRNYESYEKLVKFFPASKISNDQWQNLWKAFTFLQDLDAKAKNHYFNAENIMSVCQLMNERSAVYPQDKLKICAQYLALLKNHSAKATPFVCEMVCKTADAMYLSGVGINPLATISNPDSQGEDISASLDPHFGFSQSSYARVQSDLWSEEKDNGEGLSTQPDPCDVEQKVGSPKVFADVKSSPFFKSASSGQEVALTKASESVLEKVETLSERSASMRKS